MTRFINLIEKQLTLLRSSVSFCNDSLEVIVFNKTYAGLFPPLKTMTIKINPQFGLTSTCSRKSSVRTYWAYHGQFR